MDAKRQARRLKRDAEVRSKRLDPDRSISIARRLFSGRVAHH